jgi:hypothetical protein
VRWRKGGREGGGKSSVKEQEISMEGVLCRGVARLREEGQQCREGHVAREEGVKGGGTILQHATRGRLRMRRGEEEGMDKEEKTSRGHRQQGAGEER